MKPEVLNSKPYNPAAAVGRRRGRGLRCVDADFWFINSCTELRRAFPCEGGCAVELGHDVPNYVVDARQPTYQKCLVNQVRLRLRV